MSRLPTVAETCRRQHNEQDTRQLGFDVPHSLPKCRKLFSIWQSSNIQDFCPTYVLAHSLYGNGMTNRWTSTHKKTSFTTTEQSCDIQVSLCVITGAQCGLATQHNTRIKRGKFPPTSVISSEGGSTKKTILRRENTGGSIRPPPHMPQVMPMTTTFNI